MLGWPSTSVSITETLTVPRAGIEMRKEPWSSSQQNRNPGFWVYLPWIFGRYHDVQSTVISRRFRYLEFFVPCVIPGAFIYRIGKYILTVCVLSDFSRIIEQDFSFASTAVPGFTGRYRPLVIRPESFWFHFHNRHCAGRWIDRQENLLDVFDYRHRTV